MSDEKNQDNSPASLGALSAMSNDGSDASNTQFHFKSASEVHFEQVIEGLFSDKDIKMKTDLTKKLAVHLARAETLIKHYQGIPALERFIRELSLYLVSSGRKGRGEMVNSLRQSVSQEMGFGSRMFGE